jgi:hypothetical protein
MATHILGTDQRVVFPHQADGNEEEIDTGQEEQGGALRGLFFAMLFNVFLLITGAAAWEIWRLIR